MLIHFTYYTYYYFFNKGLERGSLCNTCLIRAELLLTHLRYPWNKLSINLSIYLSICLQCILGSSIFLVYLGWLTNSQTHPKFQKNIFSDSDFVQRAILSHLKQVLILNINCSMFLGNSMDLNISIKALWLTTT